MNEDIKSNTEMYFRQIIAMLDLMIESSERQCDVNLLTLKDIAQAGLSCIQDLN